MGRGSAAALAWLAVVWALVHGGCRDQASDGTKGDRRSDDADRPVTGFADPATVNAARFRMQHVAYFGGMTTAVSISGQTAVVEWTGPGGGDPRTVERALTAEQTALYRDVINLIVRDELWNQADAHVEAVDGGELSFDFEVSGRKGRFKLVNSSPAHLRPFLTKANLLLSSLQEQTRR